VLPAFQGAIPQTTDAVEADDTGQGVAGFALVQFCRRLLARHRIVQPVEGEKRAFDPTDLTQGQRKTVLGGIEAHLAQR
jgi:hypothetical protein